jgi:uncharacterized RmlC-like cupin family protein
LKSSIDKEKRMKKRQALLADDVPFRQVVWGLTKDLVAPERMGSEHVRIKITEYQPGFSHKLHVHPMQEEVIFVLAGKGISETKEDKIEIGPGSVVYVPAGVHHATTNLSHTEPLRALIVKSPPDDKENQADS